MSTVIDFPKKKHQHANGLDELVARAQLQGAADGIIELASFFAVAKRADWSEFQKSGGC